MLVMQQFSLRSLFAGAREVIHVPEAPRPGRPKKRKAEGEVKVEMVEGAEEKRKPGRPRNVRIVPEEEVDEALETAVAKGLLSEEIHEVTPRKARKGEARCLLKDGVC